MTAVSLYIGSCFCFTLTYTHTETFREGIFIRRRRLGRLLFRHFSRATIPSVGREKAWKFGFLGLVVEISAPFSISQSQTLYVFGINALRALECGCVIYIGIYRRARR